MLDLNFSFAMHLADAVYLTAAGLDFHPIRAYETQRVPHN